MPLFTPSIIAGDLFKVISADETAQSVATTQPWFPTAGAVTVAADTTYYVDGILRLSNGATTHTTGINFTGTATITSFGIEVWATSSVANTMLTTGISHLFWNGTTDMTTNRITNPTSTTLGFQMIIAGVIRVNAAGTIIPNFQWSANPTGTNLVLRNTQFRLFKMGAGAVTIKGTWA